MALSGTAITALTSTFTDTQPATAGFFMVYREPAALKGSAWKSKVIPR